LTSFGKKQIHFQEKDRNNNFRSVGLSDTDKEALSLCVEKWAGAELNRRHTDFQSVAVKVQIAKKQRLVKLPKSS